ncbi:MAG TPA: DUF4349 domain-containing protein [Labilithrix sp.]|nr:DUF4349 domain-containing protein [Labilithrix sp.]
MTLGRWTVIAWLVLALGGCGARGEAASAAPPQSPHPQRSTVAGSTTTSLKKVAEERERDSDGILDKNETAPAAEPVAGNNFGAPGAAGKPADAPAPAPPPPPPPGEKRPEGPRAEGNEPPHATSMLIYTARVTMAVYQVDQGLAAVEKIAKDMGGYLALKRDREITVRVPRNRFEPALAAVDKIGDVLHRDIQAQDVTDEFVDTEIRIKNARAMQVRLKALLEKAPVKEALEIEKELRRVTDEIELLEGKLKLLKDKIAYSTITVVFEPRGSTIQSTRIRLPFPWLTSLGLPALLQLSEER